MSESANYDGNNNNRLNPNSTSSKKGSLTIVGSGYQAVRQFTLESIQAIEQADKVLLLVYDPISEMSIRKINHNSESLMDSYIQGKYRPDIYKEITQRILKNVREGLNVCVVFYGHPGVFVNPSHESIKQAHAEGFDARMLPGISAEDCLFTDLGVDPGSDGCQSFEASSFLLSRLKFDTRCHLILWQIGAIGDPTYNNNPARDNKPGRRVLVNYLEKYYSPNYEVVIYEAAEYTICKPIIQRLPLSELADKSIVVDTGSTLYIPPKAASSASTTIDYDMANKLGLKAVDVHFSIKKLFHLTSNK